MTGLVLSYSPAFSSPLSRSLRRLLKFFSVPLARETSKMAGRRHLNASSQLQCMVPAPSHNHVRRLCPRPSLPFPHTQPEVPSPLAELWVPAGSGNVSMAGRSGSWFFSPLVYLIETSNRTCLVTEQKSVSVYPPKPIGSAASVAIPTGNACT